MLNKFMYYYYFHFFSKGNISSYFLQVENEKKIITNFKVKKKEVYLKK